MLNFSDLYPSEIDSREETIFVVDAVLNEYQLIMTNIFNRMRSIEDMAGTFKISPWIWHKAANKVLSSKSYRHPILGLLKEDRLARQYTNSRVKVRHQRRQLGHVCHK
jgi:hypothetical protein